VWDCSFGLVQWFGIVFCFLVEPVGFLNAGFCSCSIEQMQSSGWTFLVWVML
jgi:hypothetical protein